MRLEPDSGGTDDWGQTTIREIGWQPAARIAAISARQLKARYEKKKPKEEPRAAASSSGSTSSGGGGGKAKAPAKTKDAVNAASGEREIDYDDGGRITVHKDGSATYRAKDGSVRKGSYKDPTPPKPKAPAGFKDDPEKKGEARGRAKARTRVIRQKPKTVVKYRRVGRQGPKVGEVPY